jgi:hypothetical protein
VQDPGAHDRARLRGGLHGCRGARSGTAGSADRRRAERPAAHHQLHDAGDATVPVRGRLGRAWCVGGGG